MESGGHPSPLGIKLVKCLYGLMGLLSNQLYVAVIECRMEGL
jgi:hypothetical protein